jgi:hypothetical protein
MRVIGMGLIGVHICVRIHSGFDRVPRCIDVVDRQLFGAAGNGRGDLSLRFRRFPGRLSRGTLEPAALTPSLDVEGRRLRGHQPRPVESQVRIL